MKKFAAFTLACVLAGSFLVGSMAPGIQAGQGLPPDHDLAKPCKLLFPAACKGVDCRMYEIWDCPWGEVEVWTGEWCPPDAPCWIFNE